MADWPNRPRQLLYFVLSHRNSGCCLASFVVRNGLGHTLDRFSLDLYVFDTDGVIARQVLLDMAPLRDDKTTVARFSLIQRACGKISRILVNAVSSCRSRVELVFPTLLNR